MAQFPGLMLWTGAWVADTAHLTRLERGTYHDLLVLMWRTPGCRVPNDSQWLARHMRMTLEEVTQELRPIIAEFCQTDGNFIFQKRLQKEFVRAAKLTHAQSVRARARWQKEKALYRGNADSAMHLSKNHLRESYSFRATSVDNSESEPDEEKQVAGEKKAAEVSTELIQLIEAKRKQG